MYFAFPVSYRPYLHIWGSNLHLAFDFIAMQDHDNSAPSKLVDNFYPSRYLLHYFGQDYTETARRSFDLEF